MLAQSIVFINPHHLVLQFLCDPRHFYDLMKLRYALTGSDFEDSVFLSVWLGIVLEVLISFQLRGIWNRSTHLHNATTALVLLGLPIIGKLPSSHFMVVQGHHTTLRTSEYDILQTLALGKTKITH